MQTLDVLIVGGGIAGLATAWHLAERGRAGVLLVERDERLAQRSSAQNAAILRTLDHDTATSEVLRRGARFLRRPPPGFTDVPLLDPIGLALIADGASGANGAGEAELRALARVARRQAEWLEGEALRARVPGLAAGVRAALFFPADGRIDIAALARGFAEGARRGGVELGTGIEVRELLVRAGTVEGVRLADGTALRARTTVLAAGGWAGRLGRAAGSRVELEPRRRHLLATPTPSAPEVAVDPRGPIVWRLGAGDEFYGRPERGGWLLCPCDDEPVDPDACHPEEGMRALALEKAAQTLARAQFDAGGPGELWCGLRTFAPDGCFVLGPDPDLTGLFWVAGLGGHGMGAAAEVGRLAAALLSAELAAEPLARAFDPRRLVAVPSA